MCFQPYDLSFGISVTAVSSGFGCVADDDDASSLSIGMSGNAGVIASAALSKMNFELPLRLPTATAGMYALYFLGLKQ